MKLFSSLLQVFTTQAKQRAMPPVPQTLWNLWEAAGKGDSGAQAQLTALANAGNAQAQCYLGSLYFVGAGVAKDAVQAANWSRKAAEQGLHAAQALLALLYFTGDGVPKDVPQAVNWNRKAAEQGFAHAQAFLGDRYATGDGVPMDQVQAANWNRRAAEQGLARAQGSLGSMYVLGHGAPKDLVIAYMWLNLSAAQGDETAIKARDALEKDMTPAQIVKAQKLSREWKPKK